MIYGLLAWRSAADVHLQRVFTLQKAAVRAVAKVISRQYCQLLFLKYNILTLYSAICYVNIYHIHKNAGNYLTHSEIHTHNTRNKNKLYSKYKREKTEII